MWKFAHFWTSCTLQFFYKMGSFRFFASFLFASSLAPLSPFSTDVLVCDHVFPVSTAYTYCRNNFYAPACFFSPFSRCNGLSSSDPLIFSKASNFVLFNIHKIALTPWNGHLFNIHSLSHTCMHCWPFSTVHETAFLLKNYICIRSLVFYVIFHDQSELVYVHLASHALQGQDPQTAEVLARWCKRRKAGNHIFFLSLNYTRKTIGFKTFIQQPQAILLHGSLVACVLSYTSLLKFQLFGWLYSLILEALLTWLHLQCPSVADHNDPSNCVELFVKASIIYQFLNTAHRSRSCGLQLHGHLAKIHVNNDELYIKDWDTSQLSSLYLHTIHCKALRPPFSVVEENEAYKTPGIWGGWF